MTTPSRYGHLGRERPNDGVLGSGTARAMKGGRVGARGRASRVERTASLFAVDRLATGKEGWLVVREAWWSRAGPGERCDPLARGWVAVKRWRLARWCPELGPPGLPRPPHAGLTTSDGSDNYDPCCSTVATLTRILTAVALGPNQTGVLNGIGEPDVDRGLLEVGRGFGAQLVCRGEPQRGEAQRPFIWGLKFSKRRHVTDGTSLWWPLRLGASGQGGVA
jgi:hypothetical protein